MSEEREAIEKIIKIIDNIELELIYGDIKYATKYLEDNGIDVEEEIKVVKKFIDKIKAQAKSIQQLKNRMK